MKMVKKKTTKKKIWKENPELKKLYRDAWDKWGKHAQMDMISEECAELIVEVHHLKRARSVNFHAIVEEMADVGIMIEQFLSIYGLFPLYKNYVEKKLKRLERKLDDN